MKIIAIVSLLAVAGRLAAVEGAANASACLNGGTTKCCSPTWAPTSTGDSPTYPMPPTAEFTCEASYTAVAKAASCTQSGLSGYTFPATATTGAYECYPDDDVPTDSCAGTAVRVRSSLKGGRVPSCRKQRARAQEHATV